MRKRILFLGEAVTLAHVARPLFLARSLPPDRFDVHFAADTHFDRVLGRGSSTEDGITHWPLQSVTPEAFLKTIDAGGILFPAEKVAGYVEEELALIEAIQPDLVVGDLRVSLGVSAPFSRLPYIAITNAYWSPFSFEKRFPAPAFRRVREAAVLRDDREETGLLLESVFQVVFRRLFRAQARGLDTVRRWYGLPPFPDYLTGFTYADRTLYADTPSLAPTVGRPVTHRYIGPIAWSPDGTLPQWWESFVESKRLLFVTLGSSGDRSIIPLLAQAFAEMDVRVVIAAGGALEVGSLPENVRVVPFLPGALAAAQAAVVVTNGGSPSSYQALSCGAPLVTLPTNMDQLLCSRRLSELRVAEEIRPEHRTVARVRAAVEKVLDDPSYRRNAQSIEREIEQFQTERLFLECIDELLSPGGVPAAATVVQAAGSGKGAMGT
ncbi:MAG: hypothetical protein KDD69_00935 [Bdellovibrionales bacterium]|nr:hypothetical protein [Bdellovibrionales bacterium]